MGGKKDTGGAPAPTPLTGAVRGIVYNYSSAAPEPGITVVLDGGGWQAETVTTSEGHYLFAGLGSGSAKLSLRLPPDAHSVMPDYPVHTGSSDSAGTNVGFYWGENPPIPVLLSADKESVVAAPGQTFEIIVSVKNQSGGEASNSEIDVQLPGGLIALKADASNGQVDFTDHRVWGRLETLPDGQTATLSVQAQFDEAATPQEKTVQIIFTYNQQITPQLVRVNVSPTEAGAQTSAATNDAASTESAISQTASDTVSTEVTTEQDNTETLIPTTGRQTTPSSATWVSLILSLIFIVGLGFAGFRAFARRRA